MHTVYKIKWNTIKALIIRECHKISILNNSPQPKMLRIKNITKEKEKKATGGEQPEMRCQSTKDPWL